MGYELGQIATQLAVDLDGVEGLHQQPFVVGQPGLLKPIQGRRKLRESSLQLGECQIDVLPLDFELRPRGLAPGPRGDARLLGLGGVL